nr:hypothetical protein [Ruminococcus sp. 1001270H_150608_F2]
MNDIFACWSCIVSTISLIIAYLTYKDNKKKNRPRKKPGSKKRKR